LRRRPSGLWRFNSSEPQAPLQAAAGAFVGFDLGQLLEHLAWRPARFGGSRQKVVAFGWDGAQADLLEL
jgi:hypothetical protein